MNSCTVEHLDNTR